MLRLLTIISTILWLQGSGGNLLLRAQEADTLSYPRKIYGTIVDEKGAPMAGVSILSQGDGNMQISDSEGRFYAYLYGPYTEVIYGMPMNVWRHVKLPPGQRKPIFGGKSDCYQ